MADYPNNHDEDSDATRRRKSAGVAAFIVICLVYLLDVSWLRWGSLVIDTFRDMNVCDKILAGKVLYKDIYYEYGFLAPVFMSALCRIFGLNIATFAGAGLAMTVLMMFSMYRISRLLAGRITALVTVLVFLFVIAFGLYDRNGLFNFIIPYSYASHMFLGLALLSLYFFMRFIALSRFVFMWAWFFAQILMFLSRPDMAMAVWMCYAVSACMLGYVNARAGRTVHVLSAVKVCFLSLPVSVLLYVAWFAAFGGFDGFVEACIKPLIDLSRLALISSVGAGSGGIVDLSMMVASLVTQAVGIALMASGAVFLSRASRSAGKQLLKDAFLGCAAVACSFAVFFILLFSRFAWNQYSCVSGLLVIGCMVSAFRILQGRGDPYAGLQLFTLFFVSLAVVARIFLTASPFSYSFCLVPGMICYYFVILELAPSWISRRSADFSPRLFKVIMSLVLILLAAKYWDFSRKQYLKREMEVVSDVGRIRCFQDPASLHTVEAVRYLIAMTPASATVVAAPECMSLNFLSRRLNPMKINSLVPSSMRQMGEDFLLSDFVSARPDYVVIVGRVTAEHGSPCFGATYGHKFNEYILGNYDLVKQIGQYPFKSDDFGVAIYRRR